LLQNSLFQVKAYGMKKLVCLGFAPKVITGASSPIQRLVMTCGLGCLDLSHVSMTLSQRQGRSPQSKALCSKDLAIVVAFFLELA